MMCAYCTEENGKLDCLKETLNSLKRTVDWTKHRLIVIDNGNLKEAKEFLRNFELYIIGQSETTETTLGLSVIDPGKNLGTAEGINLALKERQPGEYVIKCDDDWSTETVGWVDMLEATMIEHPEIGILGLKRNDVYGNFDKQGELWYNDDIFGTVTMYNPKMLDKIGYSCSPGLYGYDDVLISVRSIVAGFKNAFRVDIPIKNIDLVTTAYTEWKKREAGVYLQEVSALCEMYRNGTLDVYYNPYE